MVDRQTKTIQWTINLPMDFPSDWDNDKLIELFKDWNIYYSDGETHNDVN